MLTALSLHSCGILFWCALSMLVCWVIFIKTDIAAWADVGWSFNFTLVILYLMIANVTYAPSAVGLAFMYLFWSLRLSGHILARLTAVGEDSRYETLKKKWSTQLRLKMFGYFMFQAVLNMVLSLPLFILWSDPSAEFTALRKVAAILWVAAMWFESRADRQLEAFRRDSKNKGKVCRNGLWKYSRHPNYFFEFLIWISFALFALPSGLGWIALICPVLVLVFIFKITGIPPNEAQALKTRGSDYKKYQESTPAFFPGLPKS